MDDSFQDKLSYYNKSAYPELTPGTLSFENYELTLPEYCDKLIHCNVREEYNKLPNNQMFEKMIVEYLPVWKQLSDLPDRKKQIIRMLENLSAHFEMVHKTINNIMKGYA